MDSTPLIATNAMTLFFIYLTIIMIIFGARIGYLLIPIVAIIVIAVIYYTNQPLIKGLSREKFNVQTIHKNVSTPTISKMVPKSVDFARSLYDSPPTCKEDTRRCLRNEDLRYHRYNSDIDD